MTVEYGPGAMSRLAEALAEAMDERGISTANLARGAGIPEPTAYHLTSGRAAEPQLHTRDALDAYLAPECPGATWRIIRGSADRYPSDPIRQLCRLGQRLAPETLALLIALEQALVERAP